MLFVRNDSIFTFNSEGKYAYPPAHYRQELKYLNNEINALNVYGTDRIKNIVCYNKKGEKVRLKINQNTQIKIQTTDNYKTSVYFYPVDIFENILIGYKSRILGMCKVFDMDSITKVDIYAEFPKTEKE